MCWKYVPFCLSLSFSPFATYLLFRGVRLSECGDDAWRIQEGRGWGCLHMRRGQARVRAEDTVEDGARLIRGECFCVTAPVWRATDWRRWRLRGRRIARREHDPRLVDTVCGELRGWWTMRDGGDGVEDACGAGFLRDGAACTRARALPSAPSLCWGRRVLRTAGAGGARNGGIGDGMHALVLKHGTGRMATRNDDRRVAQDVRATSSAELTGDVRRRGTGNPSVPWRRDCDARRWRRRGTAPVSAPPLYGVVGWAGGQGARCSRGIAMCFRGDRVSPDSRLRPSCLCLIVLASSEARGAEGRRDVGAVVRAEPGAPVDSKMETRCASTSGVGSDGRAAPQLVPTHLVLPYLSSRRRNAGAPYAVGLALACTAASFCSQALLIMGGGEIEILMLSSELSMHNTISSFLILFFPLRPPSTFTSDINLSFSRYIVRMLGSAHKYGLRIHFDMHTIPGSQSGYNHSGTLGKVNVLNVIMGVADPEYIDGIPMFRIMNGALSENDREGPAHIFHNGLRAGNGPLISIEGIAAWAGFLPSSDRITLDTHTRRTLPSTSSRTTRPSRRARAPRSRAASGMCSRATLGGLRLTLDVVCLFSCAMDTYLTSVNGCQHYDGDCSLWLHLSTWNATGKVRLCSSPSRVRTRFRIVCTSVTRLILTAASQRVVLNDQLSSFVKLRHPSRWLQTRPGAARPSGITESPAKAQQISGSSVNPTESSASLGW
ncbi:hypothetical protein B0H11DRAFT_1908347 [Mycena galericulata]|nr:hypothetical protein B0H11DRAFT_1908347 [Mycena galericulata]